MIPLNENTENNPPQQPVQLAEKLYAGVRSKIDRLQQQLKTRDDTIIELQKQLVQIDKSGKEKIQQEKNNFQKEKEELKQQYESVGKQQNDLVEKLLSAKETLKEHCRTLYNQLQQQESLSQKQVKELSERWTQELKTQKQLWKDKQTKKQEEWEKTTKEKIKQSTIKGLQPEVERLLAQNRKQLQEQHEKLTHDFDLQKKSLQNQHDLEINHLKARLEQEHNAQITLLKQMHDQQIQNAQSQHQCQLENDRKNLQNSHQLEIGQLQQKFSDAEEKILNLENELKNQKQLLIDEQAKQQGWRQAVAARALREVQKEEQRLRDQAGKERQHELDMLLEKISTEHQQQIQEIQQKNKLEIERLKNQQNEQLRQYQQRNDTLFEEVGSLSQKENELSKNLRETKNEIQEKENQILELQKENQEILTHLSKRQILWEKEKNQCEEEIDFLSKSMREVKHSVEGGMLVTTRSLWDMKKGCSTLLDQVRDDLQGIQTSIQLIGEKHGALVKQKDEDSEKLKLQISDITKQLAATEDLLLAP